MTSEVRDASKPKDYLSADLFDDVDLVVFDFDGVIADSEVISLASLQETLRDYGLNLSLDAVRQRYLGTSLPTVLADVAAESPRGTADGFKDVWQGTLFERLRSELVPVPGLTELLDRLERMGMPFCIASSGSFERIGIALDAMELTDRFEHVFSADLVENGKPAPDLFLHATQKLGISPERCLVIEDSPYGIKAGRAAGMRVIGFVGGAHLSGIYRDHSRTLLDVGAHGVAGSLSAIMPISTEPKG